MGVAAPASSDNAAVIQTANAFAGCNPDLTPICTCLAPSTCCNYGTTSCNTCKANYNASKYACMANYPGCDTCVVQKKLGTAGSWNIYGQDGLIDFNAYYLRPDKNITLTPLCISKGNCSVPLYGFSTWSGQSWWGKDMTATYSVSNITAYTSAVSVLRSWPGHNISNAGAWLYGPPYAMIEFWNRQADTSGFHPEVAAAPASIINITYATLGFRPLVVSHVGCGSFYFSTLDPTNSSYWNEHWELYKFTYASV